MGELKDQADEYLADRAQEKRLRFRSGFTANGIIYAIGEDGAMYESAWSDAGIEGWRPVKMTRYEEEYVDS